MNREKKEKDNEMNVADMLCSTGYLPPRNEDDLERFDKIYGGEVFETEKYGIDADAIFNRVLNDSNRIQAVKNVSTMYTGNNSYLVASSINSPSLDCVREIITDLIKGGKK